MSEISHGNGPHSVLYWYDFVCPYCYVGQHRTGVLVDAGLVVVALPFQAHPGMPRGGLPMGPRDGLRYTTLEQEAAAAGLALRWPKRIPNSRRALAAAEWVRRHQPEAFAGLYHKLFEAHFVLGQDIDDQVVVDRHAQAAGVELAALHHALADGSAVAAVSQSEWVAREHGVDGTPAWLVAGRLIAGLEPVSEFERLARLAARVAG